LISNSVIYITLVLNDSEFSSILREIIEHAIHIATREYGLNIKYREIIDDIETPYIIINDMNPIFFRNLPSMNELVNTLILISELNSVLNPPSINSELAWLNT